MALVACVLLGGLPSTAHHAGDSGVLPGAAQLLYLLCHHVLLRRATQGISLTRSPTCIQIPKTGFGRALESTLLLFVRSIDILNIEVIGNYSYLIIILCSIMLN